MRHATAPHTTCIQGVYTLGVPSAVHGIAGSTPHLQYVAVLTPLLLPLGTALGSMLLSAVAGTAAVRCGYGTILMVLLLYATLYWVRDTLSEDQDGVQLHVGSLTIIGVYPCW